MRELLARDTPHGGAAGAVRAAAEALGLPSPTAEAPTEAAGELLRAMAATDPFVSSSLPAAAVENGALALAAASATALVLGGRLARWRGFRERWTSGSAPGGLAGAAGGADGAATAVVAATASPDPAQLPRGLTAFAALRTAR